MKKKIIVILSVILIAVSIVKLYHTFATSSSLASSDNEYNITLTESNNTLSVPAKSAKIVYYQLTNTNKGKVQYAVAYSSDNEEVRVKQHYNTGDKVSGLIDYGENKFIKLFITNNSDSDANVTLSTVLGYEHGGDLVVPAAVTLVSSDKNYLGTIIQNDLTKEQVLSITFEKDSVVPSGDNIVSYDVSLAGDDSIMLWYETNEDGLYNVHIGSDNGMTSIKDGISLFSDYTTLETIDFTYFDTGEATGMANMFGGCSSLKTLDLSTFDTSNVTGAWTGMSTMFQNCSSLTSLDLSNFDTSKVTVMHAMFFNCGNLVSLDLSSFDTSNVTEMAQMFFGCSSLTNLDLRNFNTSNVTTMSEMFFNCRKLANLDLSNFDTSNVTNMYQMFYGCGSLKTLDLSSFNTSNVTSMRKIFLNCSSLKTIYISNLWSTDAVTDSNGMFTNCGSLVGGSGTTYNSSYIDKTYARVDDPTNGNPGYLTLKTA